MFKRMAEFGPDSGGRVKGVTIVKPIVYGNVARYFGKKREEDGHTHQWTVYVKPYRNEDMSAYVKKIQFKLHESYGNPLRVVTKPPYEITETGWGEFEIIIKIFFIDPNERPVTLYHLLKLFQSDTNAMLGKKTVVSEFYDEMIFQDPTAMMQQLLTTSRQLTLGAYKHETECWGRCHVLLRPNCRQTPPRGAAPPAHRPPPPNLQNAGSARCPRGPSVPQHSHGADAELA
ncbi:hypothetical protein QTO34_017322 [Cnephaeus nilssonii]|uniref:YEATS domain-containing protein 4 n=1 Tax=Cnephaeus nilssonii TaxID=3371016 RepID=A0AA40I0S7_CNENI|nr:hypothetical protein QTO34_017322 [Eptesicus nilssonii]